ncbi:LuxR C-terminal-related transcriptional regulator [Streptomyces longwoodensis]|uniref:helix-turn-helix transcriptional regulator n=1 Tax=Streptomyces longwoodensis TaxID=68231 RepID=UPI0033D8524E
MHIQESFTKTRVVVPFTGTVADQADTRRRATPRRNTCLAHLDPQLRVTSAGPDFYQQFGRNAAATCGRSIYDLLHPSTPSVIGRHFALLTEHRSTHFVERVIGLNRGNRFSGELTGIAVRAAHKLTGIVVMLQPDCQPEETGMEEQTPGRKPLLSLTDALVLEGVARGVSTAQLATRLHLSRQGIEYHVGQMLRQLKAPNRVALVARAYSMGILTLTHWPPRVLPEFVK